MTFLKQKKTGLIGLVFILLLSIIIPYSVNVANAAEVKTVADAIANNSGTATVRGYIVGHINDTTTVSKTNLKDDFNFAIADNANETNVNKMLFVAVTASFRDAWGLKSNPTHIGKQVDVSGNLTAYFTKPGLKDTNSFAFSTPEAPIEVTPITPEKAMNFKNVKTNKITIGKPSVSVTVDNTSVITEGFFVTGSYAEFHGQGFKTNKLTLKPAASDAIFDFKGTTSGQVTVDGPNVSEIRGAENIQAINFINGADSEAIDYTNVSGQPIDYPVDPNANKAPVLSASFPNKSVKIGETVTINLANHFTDADGDVLTYTSTFGKITNDVLTLTEAEGSYIVAVTATDGEFEVTGTFSLKVSNTEIPPSDGNYYQGAQGQQGQALKTALHDIISTQKVLSYTQVWDALKQTDADPNNSNNVILFYSKVSSPKSNNGGGVTNWNREHVWAKSHGNFGTSNGPGTDIHHLRPTNVQVNSYRGNLDFDNGGTPVPGCNGCLKTGSSFEPPDSVKGDVARMLFYMATRYEKGDRVDLELNEKLNNGTNPYHGKLSVLLKWHEQDPVDAFEANRNNVIHDIQGNRNPYIDHPEWVKSIWGATPNEVEQAS
nr:endonuclease [Paenisporosarcina indica]